MSQVDQVEANSFAATGTSTYRIPRVNLLPPEIEELRRLRRTQGALAAGLVLVLAALGGAYALQVHTRHDAEQELATVQGQTMRLQAEQAKYADVPRTIAAIDSAESARQQALMQDVEWYRTLTNFSLTLPTNVWFTGLTLSLERGGGAATPPATPATTTTTPVQPSGSGGVGTLTVSGTALDHPDVATWLDLLGRQPGISQPYFSNSTRAKIGSKSVVNFESTATITSDALSHRYDRKQG